MDSQALRWARTPGSHPATVLWVTVRAGGENVGQTGPSTAPHKQPRADAPVVFSHGTQQSCVRARSRGHSLTAAPTHSNG